MPCFTQTGQFRKDRFLLYLTPIDRFDEALLRRWRKSLKANAFLKEAPIRVELMMADLQSAALATWLRGLTYYCERTIDFSLFVE